MTRKLRYTGNGAWLPSVPACDHTAASEEEAEALVATGLYEYIDKRRGKGQGEPSPNSEQEE